jgi:hypothetical protein
MPLKITAYIGLPFSNSILDTKRLEINHIQAEPLCTILFKIYNDAQQKQGNSCSELSSWMYCRVKCLSTDVSVYTAVHPRRQF